MPGWLGVWCYTGASQCLQKPADIGVSWDPRITGDHWKPGTMGAGWYQGGLRAWNRRRLPGTWCHRSCLGSLETMSPGWTRGLGLQEPLGNPLEPQELAQHLVGWFCGEGLWWSLVLTSLYFSTKGYVYALGCPGSGDRNVLSESVCYTLQCVFCYSYASPRCYSLSLKSLALVKVFRYMDCCSKLCFGGLEIPILPFCWHYAATNTILSLPISLNFTKFIVQWI